MTHSDDPADRGAGRAAVIGLKDITAWHPVPQGAEDIADRVKGVATHVLGRVHHD